MSIEAFLAMDFSDISANFEVVGSDQTLTLSDSCSITFVDAAGWTFTEDDFIIQESAVLV